MKTLEIEIPEGYELDTLDKASGKIKFKEKRKDIMERIKTLNDALTILGENDEETIAYGKIAEALGSSSPAASHQAVIAIAKALNEGWKPNWSNSNELKYYAYFEMGGSRGFRYLGYDRWISTSGVGSRLAFKSSKLAEYAGSQFTQLYKQFMTF